MRLAAVIAMMLVSAAAAQPSDALIAELEATQRRASNRSASLREREDAADKAMELRERIIQVASADDPRLPGWLLDSAAGELARLARDGSDTAVLFGIPLSAQQYSVRTGARAALSRLDRAAAALDPRLKAIESKPPDDPQRMQLDQERNVRVPFFAARARVLLASCSTGAERTSLASAAFDLVSKLSLSSPGVEGMRRVSVGAALLMRTDPPVQADLQTAIDEFGAVLTSVSEGASATTRAEAWFGLIAASGAMGRLDAVLEQFRSAQGSEPFVGPDGRPDALLAVLGADAISRAWTLRALAAQDRSLLDRAVAAQQNLLRRSDLPIRTESLRSLVYEKLSLLGGLGSGLDLPPAMDLAAAIDAAKDPARRDEAIKRLQAVAAAKDSGDFAADALWELAVLNTQGNAAPKQTLQAVEALSRLARDFPSSPRAEEAMAAALAHAQALSRAGIDGATPAYREALRIAVNGFTKLPAIDTWRYEFGRLLANREDAPVADLEAAREALTQVSGASGVGQDAARLLESVHARILEGAWERLSQSRRAGADVVELARNEILPRARRAADWAAAAKVAGADRFRVDFADALTESGDSSGRAIYDDLIRKAVDVPGGQARLRLGYARALIIAGETVKAFAILRDLATALDAPAAGQARVEAYWHAWTLMLEELGARNRREDRSDTIRANVARLESIDPALGGEPWRSRITRVRDRLKD